MRCKPLAVPFAALLGLFACLPAPAAGAEDTLSADEQTLRDAGLGTDGTALLDFYRQRTLNPEAQDQIRGLVRRLGDHVYRVRRKASSELVALGTVAVPFLNQATHNPDPEVSRR